MGYKLNQASRVWCFYWRQYFFLKINRFPNAPYCALQWSGCCRHWAGPARGTVDICFISGNAFWVFGEEGNNGSCNCRFDRYGQTWKRIIRHLQCGVKSNFKNVKLVYSPDWHMPIWMVRISRRRTEITANQDAIVATNAVGMWIRLFYSVMWP